MKSTILLAGAGGYIGIPLCHLLVEHGYDVIAFDRFFFGRYEEEFSGYPQIRVVRGDIRHIDSNLLKKADAVVDVAGLSNDPAALISRSVTYSINYHGACNLAQAARDAGIGRYVYMSSASVYGCCGAEPAAEDADCHPQSLYAELKLEVELALERLRCAHFQPVLLRNSTVFGLAPRMRYDLAVNFMTLTAVRDGAITINGDGRQRRPFIHVRDVARAVLKALRFNLDRIPERVFNIGGDELNHDITQLATAISRQIPDARVLHRPQSPDSRDYRLCFARARQQLGFTPTLDIAAGVKEIAHALNGDLQAGRQPTCFTAQWYQELIEWEKRLAALSLNGRIL